MREAIPHAGRLRVRLAAGTATADVVADFTRLAQTHGLSLDTAAPTPPDLEDMFVAVLEQAESGAVRG